MTFAVGWVQKDKDGYWRYMSYYLTEIVDVYELLDLESEHEVERNISSRFKNTDNCDYSEFISLEFFEKHALESVYILEHENGNRWKMNLTMLRKGSKRQVQLKYREDDEEEVQYFDRH